ncbi:MAG: zinc finger domain-containing protein [Parasutterella excrementihominis]
MFTGRRFYPERFCLSRGGTRILYFNAKVYGKAGKPCSCCGRPIKKIVQNKRATYFCSYCQRR